MKLSTRESQGAPITVIETGEGDFDYSALHRRYAGDGDCGDGSIASLIRSGRFHADGFREILDRAAADGGLETARQAHPGRVLCPLPAPGKIIGVGWNYAKHAAEGGFEPPEEPVYFSKSPGSVIGPGEPVRLPAGIGRIDPEAELAVVIGRRAKGVRAADAPRHIAGYTAFNDVTARDMQRADQAQKRPWFRSKSIDTFGPLGPCIVTPDAFGWPPIVEVSLRVNGEVRQQESTANLIFQIPALIEVVSRWITLEPGDVIVTGTPDGIAPVIPGDEMTVSITGIGDLVNRCVAAD